VTRRLFVAGTTALAACSAFGVDAAPAPSSPPVDAGPETSAPEAGLLDCPAQANDPTLVAYYPFETDGVAKDCSGRGHDGVLVGKPTWDVGKIGRGLRLDGSSCVDLGRSTDFDVETIPFTVTAWVNIGAFYEASTYIIGKSYNSDESGWRLGTTPGWETVSFNMRTVARLITLETDIVSTGRWLHLAMVFVPGGTSILHLDGVRVDSKETSSPIVPPDASLRIGCKPDKTASFVGVLDEVRIYRRALSADEIRGLARP
jgi:hypothetical protein